MPPTTNVPAPTWTSAGFVAQPDSAILAGVQADFQQAFNNLLNFTTSAGRPTNATPQAQLADAQAAVVSMVQDLFVLYTNLVDPALSFGRMHDAIGRIYFVPRIAASSSQVQLQCIGSVGTIILIGSLVQDVNQKQWTALASGTIPISGTVTIAFACVTQGPVPCAAGALDSSAGAQIVDSIPGWDAINNSADALLGRLEETDQAYEVRRSQSTAQNATGWEAATRAALLGVPGVVDAYVVSNLTGNPTTVMGVSLAAYSLWISVEGGTEPAIAAAIFSKHSPGAPMGGNTTYTVYDTQQGFTAPYPAYVLKWQTPVELPILVSVTLANLPSVPSNALSIVQDAIVLAFSGADQQGYSQLSQPTYGPLVTWPTLYAQRLADALNQFTCWRGVQVIEVLIGSPNNASAVFLGTVATSMGVNTLTVSAVDTGALAVGQALMDELGNVPAGVTILSQSSGTAGSTGTYIVSGGPFTVTVSQFMYGVLATQEEITIELTQFPSIAAGNVSLILA